MTTLPTCPTGRQIVQTLNGALETHAMGMLGSSDGFVEAQQKVRDAINSPKSELGVEIPLWPWSDEPTYCDGSPQKTKAAALLASLAGETAAGRAVHEERVKAISETITSWWERLKLWGKIAAAIAIILVATWIWRGWKGAVA